MGFTPGHGFRIRWQPLGKGSGGWSEARKVCVWVVSMCVGAHVVFLQILPPLSGFLYIVGVGVLCWKKQFAIFCTVH